MNNPYALKIYTDGSAYKNSGGPGGIAGIAEFPDNLNKDNRIIFKEGFYKTSSNRMELRACLKALECIPDIIRQFKINSAIVITDSSYVTNNQNNAIYWRKNDWERKNGRFVWNRDLWKEFLSRRQKVRFTEIQWEKGKSSPILKEVDRLAKNMAETPSKIDFGFRPGSVSRSQTPSIGSANSFLFINKEPIIIRVYKKKSASGKDYMIYFDLFSIKDNKFVGKYYIYTTIKNKRKLHKTYCYKITGKNNLDYSIIKTIEPLEKCPNAL